LSFLLRIHSLTVPTWTRSSLAISSTVSQSVLMTASNRLLRGIIT